VRGGTYHFVYSKLLCWVALDRGLRLAAKRSLPHDKERWQKIRTEIYDTIMERGWSEKRQAFVQRLDSHDLDASTLLMPLVFFISPNHPRMLKTLKCVAITSFLTLCRAICQQTHKGGLLSDSLVHRYSNKGEWQDQLHGEEGSFDLCSFWLVEALTRAGMYDPEILQRARLLFEKMLSYANHLGLYSEEIGRQGEALGNFPQAFTHLALISAAFNLDRCLDGVRFGKEPYVPANDEERKEIEEVSRALYIPILSYVHHD